MAEHRGRFGLDGVMIPEFRVNLISGVDEDSGFWLLGSGFWVVGSLGETDPCLECLSW